MDAAARTLLEITLASGIIWCLLMIFKRVFRERLSPKAHLLLWAILIARLVMPFTIESDVHFITLPPEESASEDIAVPAAAEGPIENIHDGAFPAAEFSGAPQENAPDVPVQGPVPAAGKTNTEKNAPAPSAQLTWDTAPADLFIGIWVTGMLVSAAIAVHAYAALKKDVSSRMVDGSAPLHILFQEVRSELGIRDRIFLAVQSKLAGPALMFPNIVLLHENMLYMDPEQTKMALRHELTHFVRKDHITSLGLALLKIVWWFNPFVWLSVKEIREDIETACDNDVVHRLERGGKKEYAQTVLSMFGKTETNQAVLGMAFGGAKKNAERRIRGIFRKSRTSMKARAGAAALAGVLVFCGFTTVWQPAHAQQPRETFRNVTSQVTAVPHELTEVPEQEEPAASEYVAAGHWSDTIVMDPAGPGFTIRADVDVMVPENLEYRPEVVEQLEISQELADTLIDLLAPDAGFVSSQTVGTKDDWTREIQDMLEILETDKALGDAEAVEADLERIDEMEKLRDAAPDEPGKMPATTQFTYASDYIGQEITSLGPNYIAVSAENPDGSVAQFDVRRGDASDPSQFPYFRYVSVDWQTEEQDRYNVQIYETEIAQRATIANASASGENMSEEEYEQIWAEESLKNRLMAYEDSPIDLDEAAQRGRQWLRSAGIEGLEVVSACRALTRPYTDDTDETAENADFDYEMSDHAAYLELARLSSGVPVETCKSQTGMPLSDYGYAAPFFPESGYLVLDQDGKVLAFSWENPCRTVKTADAVSDVLTLEDAEAAKSCVADTLYLTESTMSKAFLETNHMEYEIQEMKLVTAYISSVENAGQAQIVPAWHVVAQGYAEDEDNDETAMLNQQELMINALDGAPIFAPGSETHSYSD